MKRLLCLFALYTLMTWSAGATAQSAAADSNNNIQLLPSDENIPSPEIFTPFDTPPRQINDVAPLRPDNVSQAGKVIVKYYVDKQGFVRSERVIKATPPGLGFEETALTIVRAMRFDPALLNNKPVGAWVGQVIQFSAK
jgi:TonB family protein